MNQNLKYSGPVRGGSLHLMNHMFGPLYEGLLAYSQALNQPLILYQEYREVWMK
ncbi:unnamed protein product [Anisakis simplex]|uniref:Uncharacterized protein n=1 Tax=Anisakis simplex TaxID=6269 RepID=A0A3P6PEI1_ANISI|nr:unnamed protein product [Anisakis simplex]